MTYFICRVVLWYLPMSPWYWSYTFACMISVWLNRGRHTTRDPLPEICQFWHRQWCFHWEPARCSSWFDGNQNQWSGDVFLIRSVLIGLCAKDFRYRLFYFISRLDRSLRKFQRITAEPTWLTEPRQPPMCLDKYPGAAPSKTTRNYMFALIPRAW